MQFSLAGPKRDNQDAIYSQMINPDVVIGVVADGVGGAGEGGAAAACVIRATTELIARQDEISTSSIIRKAHSYINLLESKHAATTASVLLISNYRLKFSHTGDSRIYILRNEGVLTLTEDQTEVAILVKEGVLTPKDALTYRRRNILTHAVEKGQELNIQEGFFQTMPGDRVFMMTDGVYKVLRKTVIRDISLRYNKIEEFSAGVEQVISSLLIDDASAVIIQVD